MEFPCQTGLKFRMLIPEMKTSLTTICGLLAAVSHAIAEAYAEPHWLHLVADVVSVGALAGLGFFATDSRNGSVKAKTGAVALISLGAAALLCSCKVATFEAHVSSPALGAVGVQIGGGAIGRAAAGTNSVAVP